MVTQSEQPRAAAAGDTQCVRAAEGLAQLRDSDASGDAADFFVLDDTLVDCCAFLCL